MCFVLSHFIFYQKVWNEKEHNKQLEKHVAKPLCVSPYSHHPHSDGRGEFLWFINQIIRLIDGNAKLSLLMVQLSHIRKSHLYQKINISRNTIGRSYFIQQSSILILLLIWWVSARSVSGKPYLVQLSGLDANNPTIESESKNTEKILFILLF